MRRKEIPESTLDLSVVRILKLKFRLGLFASTSPFYPFGFGLSYTGYSYSIPELSSDRIATDESVSVSVNITNTGTRAGEEIVQLYIEDEISSVTRSVLELKEF